MKVIILEIEGLEVFIKILPFFAREEEKGREIAISRGDIAKIKEELKKIKETETEKIEEIIQKYKI